MDAKTSRILLIAVVVLLSAVGVPPAPPAAGLGGSSPLLIENAGQIPDQGRFVASGAADLLYSAFLGGSDGESSTAVAVDARGALYVTGSTASNDFPATPGALDTSYNGGWEDAFVAKLSPDGTALEYVTFLGGSDDDQGFGIAVDAAGAFYVVGETESSDFPVTPDALDTALGGDQDVFVAKLTPDGSGLEYATYLGGSGRDLGTDIALGETGAAHVGGWTDSTNFPTTEGALDTDHNGDTDAFVAKLTLDGAGLEYATYLGGAEGDAVYGLDVDRSGAAYLVGNTRSPDFPATDGAFDTACGTDGACDEPYRDAFAAKLTPDGTALAYATFLGGRLGEDGNDAAVDRNGSAYAVGVTASPDFPTTSRAFDTTCGTDGTCDETAMGGFYDTFVVKLTPVGSTLAYATFLGGELYDSGDGIVVDGAGAAYVFGNTISTGFPTTSDAFDASCGTDGACNDGEWDGFLAGLAPDGSALSYATYVGGGERDFSAGLARDAVGMLYLAGRTYAVDYPTTPEAFDPTFNGGLIDAFVTKLSPGVATSGLSGEVLDGRGEPLSGIVIESEAGIQAVTGGNGVYGFPHLPAGTYTLTPTTPGYFWTPAARTITVPPDAGGEDFVGRSIVKASSAASSHALDYGEPLTYTLSLIAPGDETQAFYDPVPTHTVYVSGSLRTPAGVAYDAATGAISGTLELTATVPMTVSFAARVAVTGTVDWAPCIVNRACVHPPGSDLSACEWSNETTNYTYLWSVFLPLVLR